MISIALSKSVAATSRGSRLVHLPKTQNYDPCFRSLKNIYSAVSSGSESTTASNKRFRALLLKENIKRGVSLAQNPRRFVTKLINFRNTYSSIGYSCLAYEESSNEYFACIGQYASHSEYLHVPIPLTYRVQLDQSEDNRCYALVGITAIAVNAVKSAIRHSESGCCEALVIGGGILGTLCALYLRTLDVEVSVADTNPVCLAYKSGLRPPTAPRLFSIIIDATGSSFALGQYIRYISPYAGICLLGESEFPPVKSQLEALNATLTFANSFGSDRGDLNYELYGNTTDQVTEYRSIQANVEEAIKVIKEGHIDALIPNFVNPIKRGAFRSDPSSVNIIPWMDL